MSIKLNATTGISATGNIATDNQLLGDGSYLSNLSAATTNFTNIQSDIIPTANVTYTLGNSTNQWQDLWVSNSTVYINSIPISVNANNDLTVNGGVALVASNTAIPATGNISTSADIIAGNISIGVSGNFVYGDGTEQQTAYSNVILAAFMPGYSGNLDNVGNISANGFVTVGENFSTAGNITAGANVYANNLISNNLIGGTLTTSFQPNITSVGNLTSLAVLGITGLANLTVAGNAIVGNIQALGNVNIPPGNVTVAYGNSSELFGDSYGSGALYAGINDNAVPTYSNTVAQFTSEYTDYTAINFQNLNSGNKATTDYILSADNGTDATNYVDLGIASSTFDGTSGNNIGNVVQANDAYLYALASGNSSQPGGNLVLAAVTANRTVGFVAGPGDSANIILTVAGPNVVAIGNMTIANYAGDGSQLTGVTYGSNIVYGNSNVIIANTDSTNITFAINGANSGIFSSTQLALGYGAGANNQGANSVALGYTAGYNNQGANSVAVGTASGQTSQGANSVAVGYQAGQTNQGINAVAVGFQAGQNNQGNGAIAVGQSAGTTSQGAGAIALGAYAGLSGQGANSIAIGFNAAQANLLANTIVINATANPLNPGNAGVYIAPMRTTQSTTNPYQYLVYDPGNSRVTSWNINNYNTVYAPFSGTPNASVSGATLQLSSTFYNFPIANTLPLGTKFNMYSQANAIPSRTGLTSDFFYWGTGSGQIVQMYPGESLEIMSRGPGTTEYDITGGTAAIKYTNQTNGVYNNAGVWKASIPPNSPWTTQCVLRQENPGLGGGIVAYMGNDGYLYLATSDGSTISIQGQVLQCVYGSGPIEATANYTLTGTATKINTQKTQGTTGDTFEYVFNDSTNNRMYRVTSIKQNSVPNRGFVCIERLN